MQSGRNDTRYLMFYSTKKSPDILTCWPNLDSLTTRRNTIARMLVTLLIIYTYLHNVLSYAGHIIA